MKGKQKKNNMYNVYGYPVYPSYAYNNGSATAGYESSTTSSTASGDSLNILSSGVPLLPAQVVYNPQPLSRKYGLFADYVQPLYTDASNYNQTASYATSATNVFAVPSYFPGGRVVSDVITYATPQQYEQVLSDVIEFEGDERNYANIPYFYNLAAPTKRLTRIIRYKTYDVDDDLESLTSASISRQERRPSFTEEEPKREKSHRKKKSKRSKSKEKSAEGSQASNHGSVSQNDTK